MDDRGGTVTINYGAATPTAKPYQETVAEVCERVRRLVDEVPSVPLPGPRRPGVLGVEVMQHKPDAQMLATVCTRIAGGEYADVMACQLVRTVDDERHELRHGMITAHVTPETLAHVAYELLHAAMCNDRARRWADQEAPIAVPEGAE